MKTCKVVPCRNDVPAAGVCKSATGEVGIGGHLMWHAVVYSMPRGWHARRDVQLQGTLPMMVCKQGSQAARPPPPPDPEFLKPCRRCRISWRSLRPWSGSTQSGWPPWRNASVP
jgi:hypothetical protein